MYVTIRRYAADPRYVGEIQRRVQEGFVPIVRSVRGFVSYEVVDGGGGVLASISVFETKAGADRAAELSQLWVQGNLARFFRGPPQVTAGEVAYHAVREPAARERDLEPWG
ncbi:MAG TPA: hypothetical protein VGR28_01505 [Candidatus Thermoplasmatota archaeon]|jgi:hypothetical protein|nr:hypothetical protein [Candidatus Thermoplasmatota archaeon]